MLDVVCVLKTGGKVRYDASWVNKLHRAVSRHLHMPHRFVCIGDSDVDCERIPLAAGHHGFWNKLQMFQPGLLGDQVLYLDLDTVICQDITQIVQLVMQQDFVMWYEADKNIHSSAMMYWRGDHSDLWRLYITKTWSQWHDIYGCEPLYGDQALISQHVPHTLWTDHCPPEWFAIARAKDKPRNLTQVKILLFRKAKFKPNTMPDHPLVRAHWT